MPKEKQTLFTSVAAKYFSLVNRMGVSFKRGLVGKRGYTCKQFPELESSYYKGQLWSPSYFVVSCGGAPLEKIKAYIQQQDSPK